MPDEPFNVSLCVSRGRLVMAAHMLRLLRVVLAVKPRPVVAVVQLPNQWETGRKLDESVHFALAGGFQD